jgi:hypothetical protein
MEGAGIRTEGDILGEVAAPEDPILNEEFARAVLAVRFTDAATNCIWDLLQKNYADSLSPEEHGRAFRMSCRLVPRRTR